ncbi:ABC transporter permease [Haloglomus litoreum]|uniref:ABC transporter permease n=1 Tax=Haloglomus litoreum TaxID=3034026 RepID=UPI0023E7788D|nr:ABC transporter permease [Haloglomus sp. DT116]
MLSPPLPLQSGLSIEFVSGLVDVTVAASTVLILAALGEIVAQKAGVLNLGLEGMMLFGALSGFVAATATGNLYLGFGAAILVGMAVAGLHAFLCISLKSDQVISGLMITLLGIAVTTYFGSSRNGEAIDGANEVMVPLVGEYLVQVPIIGEAFFRAAPTDYLALLLVPTVWYFLYRTNLGLELTAVGEDPATADTVGVPVFKLRYAATLFGGALAGLAGAHLSLVFSELWVNNIVAGRGWIAVALVLVARWRPFRALLIAFVFAGLDAFQVQSQGLDLGSGPVLSFLMDPTVMLMYPYLATILILWLASRGEVRERLGGPAALTQPYIREE